MPDLFKDYIESIMMTKRDHMITEEDEKNYVPYIVNKALHRYMDTIMFANEMNRYPDISKRMHYDFLLGTVRSYKRPFKKWYKYEEPDNIESIREYYDCSSNKAIEMLKLLTDEQIQKIKEKQYKGGVDNARKYGRGTSKDKK